MFRLFLLTFFAGTFLTGGFRNILAFLILLLLSFLLSLGAALCCAKENEGENQKGRHTTPQRAEGGLYGSQAADPGWGVEIRTCHSKPTKDGGQRLEESIPKKTVPRYNNFFWGRAFGAQFRHSRCFAKAGQTRGRNGRALDDFGRSPHFRRRRESGLFFGDEGLRLVI